MRNILRVMRYEFLRNVRRPGYLFATFGVPLLLIVLSQLLGDSFFSTNSSSVNQETLNELFDFSLDEPIGYIDSANLFKTPMVERPGSIDPDLMRRYDDLESALVDLRAGEIASVFEFPADYFEEGNLTVHVERLALNPTSSDPIRQLVFNEVLTVVDEETLTRLREPGVYADVNLTRVTDTGDAVGRSDDESFGVIYAYGILYLLTVFATVGYLMQSVIEEKQSRLVEVLLSSIRPGQLLIGKIFANGALGLMQIGIWVTIALVSMTAAPGIGDLINGFLRSVSLTLPTALIMLVYFVLGYLMFAAVFGGIGAISTSVREGPQFASAIIFPAMIPFFVIMIFATTPNETLPTALSILPFMSPLAMPMRLLVTDVPFLQIAVSIGLQALLVVLLFWMAGRLFRVQSLLSGEVPTLNQLRKLLFSRA